MAVTPGSSSRSTTFIDSAPTTGTPAGSSSVTATLGHAGLVELLAVRLDQAFRFTCDGRAAAWRDLARRLATGAGGTPVPLQSLNRREEDAVRSFPATEWNERGEVIGSLLTGVATPHRLHHPGGDLWAWCIFDAMVAGLILDGPVTVESTCPRTGEVVGFTVRGRDSGLCLTPSAAASWVSLPASFAPGCDLRRDFCCRARLWTEKVEDASVAWLRPQEAFAVTEAVARRLDLLP